MFFLRKSYLASELANHVEVTFPIPKASENPLVSNTLYVPGRQVDNIRIPILFFFKTGNFR